MRGKRRDVKGGVGKRRKLALLGEYGSPTTPGFGDESDELTYVGFKKTSSAPGGVANTHLPSRRGTATLRSESAPDGKDGISGVPAERNLMNIDQLILRETDEREIKELKQQRRLLRNREAALAAKSWKTTQAGIDESLSRAYLNHETLDGLNPLSTDEQKITTLKQHWRLRRNREAGFGSRQKKGKQSERRSDLEQAGRTHSSFDHLSSESSDEEESKKPKHQKRPLRDRRLLLESRRSQRKHVERNWDLDHTRPRHSQGIISTSNSVYITPGGAGWIRESKGRFQRNSRKAVRVLIKGQVHQACPDSGSASNIISEEFASRCNLKVHKRQSRDLKRFQLGNGRCVWSIGRARISVKLAGNNQAYGKQWLHVFHDCPVPLILGMPFLEKTSLLTRNRHLLENCPSDWKEISSLLWIGTPQIHNRMRCNFNGIDVFATADTGADLNFISLECAIRLELPIDRGKEARRRIRFGDSSETVTIGQVFIPDLGLDWRRPETERPFEGPFTLDQSQPSTRPDSREASGTIQGHPSVTSDGIILHVLPGLPSDIILGRDFLDATNAFQLCPELQSSYQAGSGSTLGLLHPWTVPRDKAAALQILIDLGPVGEAIHRVSRRQRKRLKDEKGEAEIHVDMYRAEMFSRSQRQREIQGLTGTERNRAEREDRRKIRIWDQLHQNCPHCPSGYMNP
ncbi:hypothetical protein F4780DRAFT_739058 [Xylariomycetidae sp. FL0641]|nr:hypothetical protein F4780DRAFT_739058 [Xylariomycetidae sp. FL0641]